jgi:hypothetical protein
MAGESARDEARRAREKAERYARRAELFEKGAEGEAATAAVLKDLTPEWGAIHDVRWPSRRLANIDHVVIGPGGIFVIDSKNWSGRIHVDGGHLRQNGRSREKAVASCAAAGLAIAELARPYAGVVFPVLCFASEEPLSGWSRDVMVCSTANLTQMLLSRPRVLGPEQSRDAWFSIDGQLRAATSSPSPRVRNGSRTSTVHRSVPVSRRRSPTRSQRHSRKAQKDLARFVAAVLFAGTFVLYGPQISSVVGGVLAERFTEGLPSSTCDAGGREQQSERTRKNDQQKDGTPPRDQQSAQAADC